MASVALQLDAMVNIWQMVRYECAIHCGASLTRGAQLNLDLHAMHESLALIVDDDKPLTKVSLHMKPKRELTGAHQHTTVHVLEAKSYEEHLHQVGMDAPDLRRAYEDDAAVGTVTQLQMHCLFISCWSCHAKVNQVFCVRL